MVQNNRETQLVIRCTQELRDEVEILAREKGQSIAEWMRRTIQKEVELSKHMTQKEDELEVRIEAIVRKILAEGKK